MLDWTRFNRLPLRWMITGSPSESWLKHQCIMSSIKTWTSSLEVSCKSTHRSNQAVWQKKCVKFQRVQFEGRHTEVNPVSEAEVESIDSDSDSDSDSEEPEWETIFHKFIVDFRNIHRFVFLPKMLFCNLRISRTRCLHESLVTQLLLPKNVPVITTPKRSSKAWIFKWAAAERLSVLNCSWMDSEDG